MHEGVQWSGAAALAFTPPVDGRYHVSVAGTDEATGGYTVAVNGPAASASPSEPPAPGREEASPTLAAEPALRLQSLTPGELRVEWTVPEPPPADYRVTWGAADEPLAGWGDGSGNAYVGGTALTLHQLEPDVEYQVRVRARYGANPPTDSFSATVWQRIDDYHAGTATEGAVALDTAEPGSIDSAGDVDWFVVEMEAGHGYDVTVEGDAALAAQLVGLRNEWGTAVHEGVQWSGATFLTFTPNAGGAYHVSVAGTDEATGSYTLTVRRSTGDGGTARPAAGDGAVPRTSTVPDDALPEPAQVHRPSGRTVGAKSTVRHLLTRSATPPPGDRIEVLPQPASEPDAGGPGQVGTRQVKVASDDGNEQVAPTKRKINPPTYDGLDYGLNEILRQTQPGRQSGRGVRQPPSGQRGRTVAVRIFVETEQARSVWEFVQANGGRAFEPRTGHNLLEAVVPVALLVRLSRQPGVISVMRSLPPQRNQQHASVTGVISAQGVDEWHDADYRGEGVKIAVIDNGLNRYGDFIGTQVPDPAAVYCSRQLRANAGESQILADCESMYDDDSHHVMVTEAAYDFAPNASYYLAGVEHVSDLENAGDWLADKGVDVINMSITWAWEGPGDGTSPFNPSSLGFVDDMVTNGAVVTISAGNSADNSWYGTFRDSDGDDVLDFTAGGDECNALTLSRDEEIRVAMRWEDPWPRAATDLDMYLKASDDTVVAMSEDGQFGGLSDFPVEYFEKQVDAAGSYCLSIEKLSGPEPDWVQVVTSTSRMERKTSARSMDGTAETRNPGALSVGEAAWNATSTIEAPSARGPTPDGRIKPDLVGASGVRSEVAGRNVWGTSFSAPRVAGLAALAKQRFPERTPAQIATYLKDNALPRGSPDPNNTWGHGFAKLPADPVTQPVITGTGAVTETLTADTSTITDPDGVTRATFTYQWMRGDGHDFTEINGATSQTYVLTDDDVGKFIRLRVTFTDDAGNNEVVFSKATLMVVGPNAAATGQPEIDGIPRVERTLTARTSPIADANGLTRVSFAYQWIRVDNGVETDIGGATGQTYVPTEDDNGKRLKVKVSFADDDRYPEALTSEATTIVGPHTLVSNTGQTSDRLVLIPTTSGNAFTAVAQSFTTGDGIFVLTDVLAVVAQADPVVEIWTDAGGEPGTKRPTLLNPSDIPGSSIGGAAPSRFTAPNDLPLAANTTYWVTFARASGTNPLTVDGITSNNEDDDGEDDWLIGNNHRRLTGDPGAWTENTGFALMIKVRGMPTAANVPAIGELRIGGAAQVGEALTADASAIRDRDGLTGATFAYQWIRVDGSTETDIDSATGMAYTLADDDDGKQIKVKVSFTDDAGNAEEVVSSPAQPVRPEDGLGVMVTNLGQEYEAQTAGSTTFPYTWQSFTTGSHADGYTLSGVRVGSLSKDAGVVLNVFVSTSLTIAATGEKIPGRALYLLSTATDLSTDHDAPSTNVDFTVDNLYLDPDTTYWVQFFVRSGSGEIKVGHTASDAEDVGGAPGWSIGDTNFYLTSDSQRRRPDVSLQFAVLGKAGAGNILPNGAPTISGATQVGETLTADPSDITDANGLSSATFTYQWIRVDSGSETDIDGATASTYVLTDDDADKQIRVRATFPDDDGFTQSLTSVTTQVVRLSSGGGMQVSNLDQPGEPFLPAVTDGYPVAAVSFTTGNEPDGYVFDAVWLGGIVGEADAVPEFAIYSHDSTDDVPNASLRTLSTSTPIPTDRAVAVSLTTASDLLLAADTTYWLVFEKSEGSPDFYLYDTQSTDEDVGAAPGWSIGDLSVYQYGSLLVRLRIGMRRLRPTATTFNSPSWPPSTTALPPAPLSPASRRWGKRSPPTLPASRTTTA